MSDRIPQKETLISVPFAIKDDADDSYSLNTNGVAVYISSPVSDAFSKAPPKKTKLVETRKITKVTKGEFEDQVSEFDIKLIDRGQVSLSLFPEDNEIKLSDKSHAIFVCLLAHLKIYFETYGRDVENLRVNITLNDVAKFLGTELSKNNRKEMRLARSEFYKEIAKIRAIGRYTYYENGKPVVVEIDTGVFSNSWTRKTVGGKIEGEGYRISPDFYYSLVNCHFYKQIPFTAFASSGKYGFSMILDLYTHSRENQGKQEVKTKTLLKWLGLDTNSSAPSFGTQIKKPIIDQLRNSRGLALKSFKFIGATDSQELDLDTCKNKEWVDSTLIWDQMIPTETNILTENKARVKKIAIAKAIAKAKRQTSKKKKDSPDQS